ncbi:Voltage-gated hydrogen channel 1 [Desmophyllum pertusum]|uniref:Voltage-gated hydrogen channel 1 n=1 Tax=Desmophyllum pertusum TaxID=174260 RepID=A0A9X0D9F5_9CNID|nr:Voltage-gated hydrogen channel 1 [Desmophyllum pertusum]
MQEPDDQRLVDDDDELSFPDLNKMEQATSSTAATESAADLTEDESERPNNNHREQICELLHSRKAQYAIIALVVLDMIIVIVELLLDLRAIEVHHDNPAPHILHYISIAILSIFMIELFLKIYAMGLTFLKHKMEVFDGIVVIVSFSLDVAFSGKEGAVDGISLIVLLRLWRVTRIINGIVLSVKMQAERQIEVLEKENSELKEELEQLKTKCAQLEAELKTLKEDHP